MGVEVGGGGVELFETSRGNSHGELRLPNFGRIELVSERTGGGNLKVSSFPKSALLLVFIYTPDNPKEVGTVDTSGPGVEKLTVGIEMSTFSGTNDESLASPKTIRCH